MANKVFITDETNDHYTADVTNAKKLKVETGAAGFYIASSAFGGLGTGGISGAQVITTAATWLKNLVIGTVPTTATQICLYNALVSANSPSSFGSSGDHIISRIIIEPSGAGYATEASALELAWLAGKAAYPKVIPFNIYCSSGLMVGIGEGTTHAPLSGNAQGVTVTYQT